MNRLKLYAGDALIRLAGVCSRLGRDLLGNPVSVLAREHHKGEQIIKLEEAPPGGIAKALRLCGTKADEVVKVRKVSGQRVEIDRPLGQNYDRGAVVKVLI